MFQAALTTHETDADSAIWTCSSVITDDERSCRFSDDEEVSECVYAFMVVNEKKMQVFNTRLIYMFWSLLVGVFQLVRPQTSPSHEETQSVMNQVEFLGLLRQCNLATFNNLCQTRSNNVQIPKQRQLYGKCYK